MNKILKVSLVFLVVICVGVAINIFTTQKNNAITLSYSEFTKKVEDDQIGSIKIDGEKISGITKQGNAFITTSPGDQYFANTLIKKGIAVDVTPSKGDSMFWTILISWFPMFLLIGVWIFFMKKSSPGGSGGMFSVGKNKAVMIDPSTNKIKFADVAGCDEAKEEVKEIVDFLKEPRKYENLGGKTPKGILLVGPPGTGKTLLARAIAGEAGVPFYSAAGSDFVEMFVGVGAARVRDMFEQAKKTAPCIIFIDEIDTIGGKRGGAGGAANDERDSTLNQLLVAMDGFESNSGIIIIGATNRPETLDDALVRPGRLDRQIVVPLPDVKGREAILHTHIQTVPIDNTVDLKIIARGTPGFSGADLANLINEAAIMAAKDNLQLVSMRQLEKAKDKILMGSERTSMIMPEHERINTAYHEAGHAIIALMVKDADPLYKVSIIPRSKSLGVTMQLPTEDKYSYTKSYMLNKLTVLFGGRCAEEIFMKDATTGASDDFKRATAMARGLVCTYGLSDLGVMVYQSDKNYYGYEPIAGETQREVDNEIKKILTEQYNLATKILTDNKEKVELLAKKLLEVETLDVKEINILLGLTEPQTITKSVSDAVNNPPSEETIKQPNIDIPSV